MPTNSKARATDVPKHAVIWTKLMDQLNGAIRLDNFISGGSFVAPKLPRQFPQLR